MKSKEITVLMINIICVKLFLTFPRALVINSGNGAWLQMILASALVYFIFCISMKIYRVCGMRDIIDVSREIGGKGLSALMGVILFCLLGANIGILMRVFPESIKMFLLPDTEIEYIVLIFAFAAAFGAFMGLKALSSVMSIILFPAAAIILVFLISLFGECHITNISPVFGKGITAVLGGWNAVSIFSDIILFNLLLPNFNDIKEAERSGKQAIIFSGAIGLLITVVYTMIYPYPISSQILMPVYRMVRSVDVVGVFGRAESVLAFVWCILTFISSGVYVYEMSMALKKGFSLENNKMLIIPSAVIVSSSAAIDMNIADVLKNECGLGSVVYLFAFILPVLTAAIYMIKNKAVKK